MFALTYPTHPSSADPVELKGRRHKHLCTIPVKGEPCSGCSARSRPCTFTIAPTQRVRKPAVPAPEGGVPHATSPAESQSPGFQLPVSHPALVLKCNSDLRMCGSVCWIRSYAVCFIWLCGRVSTVELHLRGPSCVTITSKRTTDHIISGAESCPQASARAAAASGLAGIFRELRTLRLQEDGILDLLTHEPGAHVRLS